VYLLGGRHLCSRPALGHGGGGVDALVCVGVGRIGARLLTMVIVTGGGGRRCGGRGFGRLAATGQSTSNRRHNSSR